jgi:hypothetical protein
MLKSDAIRLLGGTTKSAADACRITLQAVSGWPDVLTRDIEDRVLAALARKHLSPEQLGAMPAAEHVQACDNDPIGDTVRVAAQALEGPDDDLAPVDRIAERRHPGSQAEHIFNPQRATDRTRGDKPRAD